MPTTPPDPTGFIPVLDELAAALATVSPEALLSDHTAGRIWGLWTDGRPVMEMTVPATCRGSSYTTGIQQTRIMAHRRRIDDDEITMYCGLRITTPARTWLDLVGSRSDFHDVVALGDSALRAGLDEAALEAAVARWPRIRGRQQALRSIPLLDERSRSRPESRIRSAIVTAGLPRPEVNVAIFDEFGGWLAEPDLVIEEAKIGLEYNGADHASLAQMRKDSVRLLSLQREGWEIRTYTAPHAFGRLDEVVSDVRGLLLRRAPHLLRRAGRRLA
jgi:hypothetical protein